MLKLVTRTDLKSVDRNWSCGFESHSEHIIKPLFGVFIMCLGSGLGLEGGRGNNVSPCRKLFKTEGFERVRPRRTM